MTALAAPVDPRAFDAPLTEEPELAPRLLRSVPTAPPYDDDERAPVAEVLPLPLPGRFGAPVLDLPALARLVCDPPEAEADGRVVDAELRRLFGPQRTPRSSLPAPAPRAAAALRLLLEVVAGERPVRQVAGWVAPGVLAGLDRRTPRQRRALGRRPQLRSIRVTEPAESVAEVSAVVTVDQRVRAVALRLEGLDGRWTVTALHIG